MLLYSHDSAGRLEVLLGRRAWNPGIGTWSIPGGALDGARRSGWPRAAS